VFLVSSSSPRKKLHKIISEIRNDHLFAIDAISLLSNVALQSKCYILSGGPSTNDIDATSVNNLKDDVIVVAVKQAYYKAPLRVDIHLINDDNYQVYDYSCLERKPLVVKIRSSLFRPTPFSREDILLKISKNQAKSFDNCLALTGSFDQWKLNKCVDRPWGPGIMYELGIYIPLLLGSGQIYVSGWDLGVPDSSVINRFYEKEGRLKYVRSFFIKSTPNFYNAIFVRLENLVRFMIFPFNRSVLLNIPGATFNEASIIAASTDALYNFLSDEGVVLKVISNQSMLTEKFERVSLEAADLCQ
jgi:hypothetical protein